MKYIATMRLVLEAEDDVAADLAAEEVREAAAQALDEDVDETIDVTQVIKADLSGAVEPAEVVEQLRRSRDLLILTRLKTCFELAKELDKVAWVLEHRREDTFDLGSYDYGSFFDRARELLDQRRTND